MPRRWNYSVLLGTHGLYSRHLYKHIHHASVVLDIMFNLVRSEISCLHVVVLVHSQVLQQRVQEYHDLQK
jgi:hypothetical protein